MGPQAAESIVGRFNRGEQAFSSIRTANKGSCHVAATFYRARAAVQISIRLLCRIS